MNKILTMLGGLVLSKGSSEISISKVTMIVGVAISSWVMYKLAQDGRMSSEIFGLFLAATCGSNSVNKAISVYSENRDRKFRSSYYEGDHNSYYKSEYRRRDPSYDEGLGVDK